MRELIRKVLRSLRKLGDTDTAVTRTIIEYALPISQKGTDVKEIESLGHDGGILATDFEEGQRPDVFTPTTAILNGGYGIWELTVPGDILETLEGMKLVVDTNRTHGMLHTPPFDRSEKERRYATVCVNRQLVDKIDLVRPHPHGGDFGVDSRRPFDVFEYMDRDSEKQEIRIDLDDKVLWDIDKITLKPSIYRKEIRPMPTLVIGGVIGAIISLILGLLLI